MKHVFSGYVVNDDYGFLCLEEDLEQQHYGNSIAGVIADAFPTGGNVFVRFFVTDSKVTKDQATEALIHRTFGFDKLHANYVLEAYSEWTIEAWEEELTVGGHNLLTELNTFLGKYVVLIIEDSVAPDYSNIQCL